MMENETKRSIVLGRKLEGTLTLVEAARILGISYRQAKRVWKRFREEGEKGLAHKSRGKPSNRAHLRELKQEVVNSYRSHPMRLGPTRFAQILREGGIDIDHETLRRWLRDSGAWGPIRGRRMKKGGGSAPKGFGELLTLLALDGNWLGIDLPASTLFCLRDEATSLSLSCLSPVESCESAMRLLWSWIDRYGIPAAIRSQRRLISSGNRNITPEHQITGEKIPTPFSLACARLGIDEMALSSSRIKCVIQILEPFLSSIEHGLERYGASNPQDATTLLQGILGEELNGRFANLSRAATDFHVPIIDGTDLRRIFCRDQECCVKYDRTIEHDHRTLRVTSGWEKKPNPVGKVVVSEWLDGSLHVLSGGVEIPFTEVTTAAIHAGSLAM